MNITYQEEYYFLDFTNAKEEEIFFVNSINLSVSLITESHKQSEELSKDINKLINQVLKFHRKNKLIRKHKEQVYKVRKEYLDLLLEHIETVLMIILKEESKTLEISLKSQYEFLSDFFKRFLEALKNESENKSE